MTIEIPLTKGYVAIVDDQDAPVHRHVWYLTGSSAYPQAYAVIGRQRTSLVRYIASQMTDAAIPRHYRVRTRNGNALDCRRANLVLPEYGEVTPRRHKTFTAASGYPHVGFRERGGWYYQFRTAGVTHAKHGFATAEAADAACRVVRADLDALYREELAEAGAA